MIAKEGGLDESDEREARDNGMKDKDDFDAF